MRKLLIAVAIQLVGITGVIAAPPKQGLPKPKEVQAAVAQIRKTHAKQYADRTPKARSELSKTLRNAAQNTANDSERYALLAEASQLSVEGGAIEDALAIAIEISDSFKADPIKLQVDLLTTARSIDQSPESSKSLCQVTLNSAARMIDADNFSGATTLLNQAQIFARQSRDPKFTELVTARVAQVRELAKEHKNYLSKIKTLENNPNDHSAKQVAGSYLCFLKGDWESGLPLLAEGSEVAIAAIAKTRVVIRE